MPEILERIVEHEIQEGNDDSPGPSCEVEFTSKEGGKYTIEVVNKGPGANSSTLKVSFGKKGK
jgi:hypothetical protein